MTTPRRTRLASLAYLAFLAAACAAHPPPAAAHPSLPPLPRSSIAAVLLHREELGLDEAQVRGLRGIDDELAQRQEIALRGAPLPAPAAPLEAAGEDSEEGEGALARRGGGRHAGGRERRDAEARPADRNALWDDNDTAAFHQAEGLLRPGQVGRAREIAEQFRERRYDTRAARGANP